MEDLEKEIMEKEGRRKKKRLTKKFKISLSPAQKTVRTGKRLPKVRLMTMATKMAPFRFMIPA